MVHYPILFLLIVHVVKSSIKVQRLQRAPSCPMDFKGWKTASDRLDCSTVDRNFTYHCSPAFSRSYFVEYCYFNYLLKDGCLILKEDELLPTIVSCKTFAWGCPSSVFNSSELYKFDQNAFVEVGGTKRPVDGTYMILQIIAPLARAIPSCHHPACLQIHDVHGCFLDNSTCTTTIPNDPKSCENDQPPVDGQWSEFISHGCTECSVTCGNGSQKFIETRECNNPIPENGGNTCNGSAIKVTQRACNVQKCQVDGQWSEFISLGFTECSVTCGNGSQKFIETRECNNPIPENGGNTCNGSAIKVTQRACNVQKYQAYEEMPKYSEWSDCSATCGIGAQIRVRLHACSDEYFQSDIESNTSGTELETRSCKIRNCQYFKNYPFISIEFLSSICVATILSFLFGIWVRSITCKRPVKEERDYANTGHNQIQRTANERYSNYHLRYDVVESCEDVPEYSSCDDAIITHGSWQQTEKMKYYNDSLYGEPCSAPHIKDQCSESEDSNSYYCNTVINMVENKMDMENNEYENIGSINM